MIQEKLGNKQKIHQTCVIILLYPKKKRICQSPKVVILGIRNETRKFYGEGPLPIAHFSCACSVWFPLLAVLFPDVDFAFEIG